MIGRLSLAAVTDLFDIVVALGLDRHALLSGVDASFVAGLHICSTFSAQTLCDLHALNNCWPLADGSDPLSVWLTNAYVLCGLRAERDIVARHSSLLVSSFDQPVEYVDTSTGEVYSGPILRLRIGIASEVESALELLPRADDSEDHVNTVTSSTIVTAVFRIVKDVSCRACIVHRGNTAADIERFDLPDSVQHVSIGRSRDNDIVVAEAGVSRVHARVTICASVYWIEDIHSTTGTYLNGVRIRQSSALLSGDRFRIGPHAFLLLQERSPKDLRTRLFDDVATLQRSDAVTGLPTWQTLIVSLENRWLRMKKRSSGDAMTGHLSVVIVDGEREIRERWGNGIMDDVLGGIARVLLDQFRDRAIIAAGVAERFLVWSDLVSLITLRRIFSDVMAVVCTARFTPEATSIPLTLSVGIASTLKPTTKVQELITCARECGRLAAARGNAVHIDVV